MDDRAEFGHVRLQRVAWKMLGPGHPKIRNGDKVRRGSETMRGSFSLLGESAGAIAQVMVRN